MQPRTNLLGDFYLKAIKGVMVRPLQKIKHQLQHPGGFQPKTGWSDDITGQSTLKHLVATLFSEEGVWGFILGPSYILLHRRQFKKSKVTSFGVLFPPLEPRAGNWEQSPAGGAVQ